MQLAKAALIKYFKSLQYDTKQVDSDLNQELKLLISFCINRKYYKADILI